MKSKSVAVCVFLNLLIVGMCGYLYLIWSQFSRADYLLLLRKNAHDKEVYYYNHGYPNETTNEKGLGLISQITGHTTNKNILQMLTNKRYSRQVSAKTNYSVLIIKDSRPRFVNLQTSILQYENDVYTCKNQYSPNCTEKTLGFKNKVIMELQRIFMKESDIFKSGEKINNPYNVHYVGPKENYMKKTPRDLVCDLKNNAIVKTVTRRDTPFNKNDIKKYFPKRNMFFNKRFNSCAIIASAGSLIKSKLGSVIDSHDVVLRFNHAPTKGYEEDVGSKTTMRILNSQVVTKPEFEFLSSELYRNISVLVWDPSNYSASLEDWYKHPDYDLFPNYKQFRRENPRTKLYLVNPKSLWSIWDFLQRNSPSRLRKNPPSSGFLALTHLLSHCSYVDMFEYIPSVRITRKCHYFDTDDNPSCTFGVWHPLAAEKLIAYAMNVADDFHVFQKGFIRIPGFEMVQC